MNDVKDSEKNIMKLSELDAELVLATGDKTETLTFLPEPAKVSEAHGVMFECPSCHGHQILVWFKDRPSLPASREPLPRWTASGEGISDLSLSPSINLDNPNSTGCRWHGWVKNGDAS